MGSRATICEKQWPTRLGIRSFSLRLAPSFKRPLRWWLPHFTRPGGPMKVECRREWRFSVRPIKEKRRSAILTLSTTMLGQLRSIMLVMSRATMRFLAIGCRLPSTGRRSKSNAIVNTFRAIPATVGSRVAAGQLSTRSIV